MSGVYGKTHKGIVRSQNQDTFCCGALDDNTMWALVCDGMGGENAGDVASRMASEIVEQQLKKAFLGEVPDEGIFSLINSAVMGANAVIYDYAKQSEDYTGMGTTLVLAVVRGSKAYLCHVGDSRIYELTPHEFTQITRDHSMVQLLVDRGELTPEEAEVHPQKHYITRAVGIAAKAEPEFCEVEFMKGDVMLLCSDGLSNYFQNIHEAEELVRGAAAKKSAQPLIDYALESGGADNITAVLIIN